MKNFGIFGVPTELEYAIFYDVIKVDIDGNITESKLRYFSKCFTIYNSYVKTTAIGV